MCLWLVFLFPGLTFLNSWQASCEGFVLLLLLRIRDRLRTLKSDDIGLCFPIPSVYCAILVVFMVPMGSWAYRFSVFGLDVNIDYVFVLVLPILCSLNIDNIICAPHSYVQVYAVAAFEDHCLVLSFGGLAV